MFYINNVGQSLVKVLLMQLIRSIYIFYVAYVNPDPPVKVKLLIYFSTVQKVIQGYTVINVIGL